MEKKTKPRIARSFLVLLIVCATVFGGVIGQILYQLRTPGEVQVTANTYKLTLYDAVTAGSEVSTLIFDSGLMAEVPGSQTMDLEVWLTPDYSPTAQTINCYMFIDEGTWPVGLDIEVGWFDSVNQYTEITNDGTDNFYSFPGGWDSSTDDRIKLRFRLVITDVAEGTHAFDVDITGEDA